MHTRRWSALGLLLLACGGQQAAPAPETAASATEAAPAEATAKLETTLAKQPEEAKARYGERHPKELLQLFGVQPGMTVVDTLPGPVFWTGILLDYLGPQGKVVDADYSAEMWTKFGNYSPDPAKKKSWAADTTTELNGKRGPDSAQVGAFAFGSVPDDMAGTVDVILLSRALHHFMRLEADGKYMTQALADMNKLLKPGGIVGVEQHRAPEAQSDASTTGERGYVKQSAVIAAFEKAGFQLVEKSEVSANAKDQPSEADVVWRLPPTLATSKDKPELQAQMKAIGETDRMTLKFKKPS
jgi:predicted methyltransferase